MVEEKTLLDVGNRKQLFFDDRIIESMQNIKFTMNPPIKTGPVLVADKLWESHRVGAYGTVIEDDGVYRLWYDVIDEKLVGVPDIIHAYATSNDGIHWSKPNLGIVDYNGSKENSLVNVVGQGTVFIDPLAPQERRYKYVTRVKKEGMVVYWSGDGLHWQRSPETSLPLDLDTHNMAFYDTRIGKYVAYLRGWKGEVENWEGARRRVLRCEMDDILQPWPYKPSENPCYVFGKSKLPVATTELPTVFAADEQDPPESDFYNSAVVQYPYAQDAYFMFPSAYRHFPWPPVGKYPNDGLLDIHLAVSRDGIHWTRVSRDPYVRLGIQGEPDSQQMYMCVGMLRRGNELWQYYFGYDYSHGVSLPEMKYTGALMRLVQRLDGFVSADASFKGSKLVTKPLVFHGRRLELNINTSALGIARVALLDENGKKLQGFGIDDCDVIGVNSVAHTVTWKDISDISSFAGKPVRLKFQMRSTKLYALQFVE